MFGPVVPTPYDLEFDLLRIPVRVSPWFWVMSAVLGWSALDDGWEILLLWILAVFVSILVHEFGHALTARAFGYPPRVLLYQFGGLAFFHPTHDFTLWRSLLITAAGPIAGLTLWGVVSAIQLGLVIAEIQLPFAAQALLSDLFIINLFWSLMNLLPVLPLDGGRICQNILLMVLPRHGLRTSLIISVIVGGVVAAWGFANGSIYLAVMFGFMAGGSLSELQRM